MIKLPCPRVITLLLPNNVESLSLQTYCQFALVKHLTYPHTGNLPSKCTYPLKRTRVKTESQFISQIT